MEDELEFLLMLERRDQTPPIVHVWSDPSRPGLRYRTPEAMDQDDRTQLVNEDELVGVSLLVVHEYEDTSKPII